MAHMQSPNQDEEWGSRPELDLSSDDGVSTESEDIHDWGVNQWHDKHYWFGKMYLRCMLAEELLRSANKRDTSTDLDSALEERLVTFPYQDTFQSLEGEVKSLSLATLRLDIGDKRQRFLTMIGAIIQGGTPEEQQILRTLLRSAKAENQFSMPSVSLASSPRSTQGSTDSFPEKIDTGIFATMLNEHLGSEGLAANYTYSQKSVQPPSFRVRLTFAKTRVVGHGKSKKEARHDAAKQACRLLQIPVTES